MTFAGTPIVNDQNNSGGGSGGSGDDELLGSDPLISESSSLSLTTASIDSLEKIMDPKDEARNELSELVKERKVKSTLVLLKKQHPSYVEGMILCIIK